MGKRMLGRVQRRKWMGIWTENLKMTIKKVSLKKEEEILERKNSC